jgi:hypothetical protein
VLALGWQPVDGWRWADRSEVRPDGERGAPVSGLGMWLIPQGQRRQLGRPVNPAMALDAFLKIDPALSAEPDQRPAQVEAFASKYGWLGRPQTLIPVDGGQVIPGEPLRTWLEELWLLRSLSAMLQVCDRWESAGRRDHVDTDALTSELIALAALAGLPVKPGAARNAPPDALIEQARKAVRKALQPRLAGQFSAVLVADDGPVERFLPVTLAAALELELARRAVKSGLEWVACQAPGCTNTFARKRVTGTYCSDSCRKAANRAKRSKQQTAQLEGTA